MSEEIKDVKLSFACNENWDAMANTEGGKHCGKCQKKVYDFTNSKADEFRKILAENNYKVCGHFSSQQVIHQFTTLPFWKRWLSAAMLIVGINLTACEEPRTKVMVTTGVPLMPIDSAKCEKDIKGEVVVPMPVQTQLNVKASPNDIFTSVEIIPEFEGGYEKFQDFINNHLNRHKATRPGKTYVTFVVEKDGSLTDVRAIGRNTDEAANKEAIRIVKLSPKWIPGKQNGKPVRVQYTIPVVFN